ncbi:MAG TPA: cupin domain-containing protein [Bryobacteraceae bacterium]|jgi:quercetin dioxygenase-like cupin family protein|nr:cupin domain-containing protein [Bryobacteraceae bacterium]
MSKSDLPAEVSTADAQHVQWDKIPIEKLNPLLERQIVVGEKVMVARILLKKGCVVPMHHHHNEQISIVESGVLQFEVNGKEVIVRAGEVLCIPPHAPHTATALEDTVDLDIFTPPREDWIKKTDEYLRG